MEVLDTIMGQEAQNPEEDEITESQKKKMLHTLGLDYKKKSFRNRYITGHEADRNEELTELVEKGLMGKNKFYEQGFIYWVTEDGAKFLGVELPEE